MCKIANKKEKFKPKTIKEFKIVETPLEIILKKTKAKCSINVEYKKELSLCSVFLPRISWIVKRKDF